jgi:uncharacterized protein (DUF58 family)
MLLACVASLGLLGFITAWALDMMLMLDVFLIGALWFDAAVAADPRRIQVAREGPNSFSEGRQAEFTYRWRNPGMRVARLIVREIRPAVLGGALAPRTLHLGRRGEELAETQIARPAHRGREKAGWFAVRSVGPLGLGQRQASLAAAWDVTVYPGLPASRMRASIAEAARQPEAGLGRGRRLGEGSQFESLRDWVPGDDTRHIDWKASARRNKVIVREYEEERRQQVLLVLDAGRLMAAEVAGQSRIEPVVAAALWLALAAHHHDDNVGVMVIGDEIKHYVPPQRGKRGLRQVLDVLATVDPALVEPDYPAAFQYLAVRNRKRALTVFFTDVIDRLASEALVARVASLRPRHLPLVVTFKNPELEDIANGRPATVADAYRKAAAEELVGARVNALNEMRRTGALVLDVYPERAGPAVVQKYLELKRRSGL